MPSIKNVVYGRFDTKYPCRFWDDGFGPLWIYQSADHDFGIVRAQTWEDAYSCVEDEILHAATHEEILDACPNYERLDFFENPEYSHEAACFQEAFAFTSGTKIAHRPMSGDSLRQIEPQDMIDHGIKIYWEYD